MRPYDNIVSGLADKVGAQSVLKGPKNPVDKPEPKPAPSGVPDAFALYEFRDLQSVIQASKLVGAHYDSENVLYKNPANQRQTEAAKQYVKLFQQYNQAVKTLCTILRKDSGDEESPLRAYLRMRGSQND